MGNTEFKWTKEQQEVIELRNHNILVSAAAGSGKTAVLVERIMSLLKSGIDINQILVVTFTKAAAAEMKGRIRKAIIKYVKANPDDEHMRPQQILINNAHICTIDSFCSYVVKNYFYEIGADGSRRIALDDELRVIKQQVMRSILEENYANPTEDFLNLSATFVSGNKIDNLINVILNIYSVSRSFPYPEEWLENCAKVYAPESTDDIRESIWFQNIYSMAKDYLNVCVRLTEDEFIPAAIAEGADKYKEAFEKDLEYFQSILKAENVDEFIELASEKAQRGRKPSAKKGEPSQFEFLDDLWTGKREVAWKDFDKFRKDFLTSSVEEIYDQMLIMAPVVSELCRLTSEFAEKYEAVKARKGLMDFADVEHMALSILRDKDTKEPTECAIALRDSFAEIMVDEYQDSNDLQEAILTAIVKNGVDSDYFNVGDVKQSIYKFRQASPALFIDKHGRYPVSSEAESETDNNRRIDLKENFRSRGEVLHFCNDIFAQIMGADLGGVEYDEAAMLSVGNKEYEGFGGDYSPEVILVETEADLENENEASEGADSEDEELDSLQKEATIVANRIVELMEDMSVLDHDKEDKPYLRPIRYSDIVILLNSTKSMGQTFVDVLNNAGIPTFVAQEEGFFDKIEVMNILSALAVFDNPTSDIDFASFLHSQMCQVGNQELADIKAAHKDLSMYMACRQYANENNSKKLLDAINLLDEMREFQVVHPIHVVIEELLARTGYLDYVSALPDGALRRANIIKLIDEASTYEANGYKSVTDFIHYIQDLRTYEIQKGQASTLTESEDVVRIMTIHKSKGLEFPVVFLSGATKSFSSESNDNGVFASAEYDLSVQFKDAKRRIVRKHLYNEYCKEAAKQSSLAERIRVLYVALTRAKEKLIITGNVKSADKVLKPIYDAWDNGSGVGVKASLSNKLKFKSYMDMILEAFKAYPNKYNIKVMNCLALKEVTEDDISSARRKDLEVLVENADNALVDDIGSSVDYQYPRLATSGHKVKYSVSELKHKAMELLDEETVIDGPHPIIGNAKFTDEGELISDNVPRFISHKEKTVNEGALYGTATHRFFECFDFVRDDYKTAAADEILRIKNANLMDESMIERLNMKKLTAFLKSDLAERMHNAAKRGQLFKEQPFFYMNSAEEILKEEGATDEVIIQGIIDAFFIEDDEIVLMDYKTDNVDNENALMLRYREQIRLYEKAIEAAKGMRIKESVLYSFKFDTTVRVDYGI